MALVCTLVAGTDFAVGAVPVDGPLLLVANKGNRSLGIILPTEGRQIAEVPVNGVTGHEVAASPDGKLAFVPIYGNSGVGGQGTDGQLIRVIDIRRAEVVGTIDYGKGVRPHCAVFGPKDGLLYVTAELSESVSVIDPRGWKILGSIPTGAAESHMLAITPNGQIGYTANVGPGSVSVLDMKQRNLLHKIQLPDRVQRISVSNDGKWVFTADQAKRRLAVIDTGSNSVAHWVELPGNAYGTAPTADGNSLLVCIPGLNRLALIDLKTLEVSRSLDLPKAPQEVLVPPEGNTAYVSCDSSRQVAAIDLDGWKVARLIEAGAGADGMAWAPGAKP